MSKWKWMFCVLLICALPAAASMTAYCEGTEDAVITSTFCNTTGLEGFGRSVALKGDYAAIGAPYNDDQGCVYVYHRSGGTWSLQDTLVAGDAYDYMMFGRSVDINAAGNIIVVGASCSSAGGSGADNEGGFYTFERIGTSWSQLGSRVESPYTETTYRNAFGYSIALDDAGNTVIVGAPGSNPVKTDGNWTGAAYIFEYQGGWTPGWNYAYTVTKPSNVVNDKMLGYRVDISGDGETAVAIPYYDWHPYVATKDGTWSQELLTYSGEYGQPKSVALRNGRIVAGIRGYPQTTGTHRIAVWDIDTNGDWNQTASIENTERLGLDDVDFNEDGSIFAITTWSATNDSEEVYVFHDVNGTWTLGASVTWSEGEATDNTFRPIFVALDQGTLLVPVHDIDDPITDPGKVFVYDMMDVYDFADVLYYCPPILEYASSLKTHTYSPTYSEVFGITEGNVEPRPDGPSSVWFGFNHAVVASDGSSFAAADITVSSGTKGLMNTGFPDYTDFGINVSNITDDEEFTMSFTVRTGADGRAASFELSWDTLFCDTDCDGDVDMGDYTHCAAAIPGEKSGFEYRCDMNLDLEIDTDDLDIICDVAGIDPCPYTQ